MIFIFCIIVFFVGFSLYSRKFNNPYKLYFIFGKKGSGKSTYMVKQMLKYQKRGYTIYTDIQDCIVPDVRIMNAADLAVFSPDPHSAIFLDEVGITFDNRNFRDFSTGFRDWFKFQRKYKVVCWQNSQGYDIDKKIKTLLDGMYLQTVLFNVIGVSRPIYKTVTLTEPTGDAESRIAEKLKFAPFWKWRFTWLPRYFDYFDSFDAPARDSIPFRSVPRELYEARKSMRKELHKLQRSFDSDSVSSSSDPKDGE